MQGMCQLAEVSRAGILSGVLLPQRCRADGGGSARRDPAHRSGVACYGRPRVTAELRDRGWTVNRKRVQRIMREDNLLCLRKRQFVVTTDSNHDLPVYPNLARDMVLTGIDQLWRADITYIRLEDGVRLSGGGPGCVLAPSHRLGAGPHAGRRG